MSDPTRSVTAVFPGRDELDALRQRHYNATVTSIQEHEPGLRVMHIAPDGPIAPFEPGQYTTLGLGYWEPRVDQASEDFALHPELLERLARRSYSVSHSIVDNWGELAPRHTDELEFYIVLVRPEGTHIPALTPRIFALGPGDRIYMGRKFTGRYTLSGVDPTDNVIFLSTGTGEAPHNQMTAKLLRDEHQGRILQVVCVRHWSDLAYLGRHRMVEGRFNNYRYVPLTTREPENNGNKVYIQDLLDSGGVEEALGVSIDASNTHFYLCGNPQMIGLPKWRDDGTLEFPATRSVCEILTESGFTLDHRRERGNVHYEEYWKTS